MDNYFEKLAIFNEKIFEVKQLWEEIKEQSYLILRENQELKRANLELKRLLNEKKEIEKDLKGSSHKQLTALYKKGYHVCPTNFTEKRRGDCLFCQRFIQETAEEEELAQRRDKAPSGE